MCRHPFRAAARLGLALAAIGCGAAMADEAGMAPVSACAITAFSTDKDPDGLNVRAGPGSGTAVIARLPPPYRVGIETFATEVSITGSKDGWFRIVRAETDSYIVEPGPKTVFEGEGWVSGRYLGLWVEGRFLYGGPSPDTPVAFDFTQTQGADQGSGQMAPARLRACAGEWVEVEGTYLGRPVRGWTDDVCASQVTTCP